MILYHFLLLYFEPAFKKANHLSTWNNDRSLKKNILTKKNNNNPIGYYTLIYGRVTLLTYNLR